MRGLNAQERREIYRMAGLKEPSRPAKFGNKWTYYNGSIFHTVGRDHLPQCPICDEVKSDRIHWYQSENEASFAKLLDERQKAGLIYDWSRGDNILLVDGGTRSLSVRYKPDFNEWDKPGPVSRRYEVKGSRGMISQQGLMRIKMYLEKAAKGLLPPLLVVDAKGHEIQLVVNNRVV